jgi:hypothetical protein
MALDTYNNLKIAVITWSKRDDLDLLIPDFIAIAEREMLANPTERLKIRTQEVRSTSTLTATNRFLALPADYLSMRKVTLIIDTVRCQLDYRTPSQIRVTDETGIPSQFTVTTQLEFNVTAEQDVSIEFEYVGGFTPLSVANQSNTILAENPNIYLFGSLSVLFRHAQDLEEEARYQELFMSAIRGSNLKARDGQYGPRPRIIPRGTKP